MSNGPVRESKYQNCICGKVCKGRAALANHGRICEMERVRSAFFLWCIENGNQTVSDAAVLRHYEEIKTKMIELGAINVNV